MFYATLTVLIMLVLLDTALRAGRLERLKLETKFKLFALRDELRMAGIRKEAPDNNWFKYLDSTLTRSINRLDDINSWFGFAAVLLYRKDAEIVRAQQELEEAFKLDENRKIAKMYYEYLSCLAQFLRLRHPISLKFVVTLAIALDKASDSDEVHMSFERHKTSGESVAPIFSMTPETSTLLKYGLHREVPRAPAVHFSAS